MERYSEYKGSGVEWLGEIPRHWGLIKSKYLWKESFNLSEQGNEELLSVSQYDGITPAKKRYISSTDGVFYDYFNEMGDNAYAMLNVLTDFSTFPAWPKSPSMYIDGYQHRVGQWVDDFTTKYRALGFDLTDYIGDEYRNSATYVRTLLEKGLSQTTNIYSNAPEKQILPTKKY